MSLSLDAVPDGSRILIDTDVWLYLFTGNSPECVRLGARCNEGAIQAYITTIVVGEFCHHAMMLEARQKGILSNNNPASFLAKRNSLVRCLGEYRVPVQHWLHGGVEVVSVEKDDIFASLTIQERFGMMTNDSLNLAVMSRLGIRQLATCDTTFDHMGELEIYQPQDIPKEQEATNF